ncbi:hypothetical protein CEP54_014097 [Fusarium duplospermum]|uniref:Uncharacterized protein n=1 Tax=Fusarium duplospermum TaxID=1325734 RepID=A0A428NYF5_9HYPO|nr:hypothetical protein CEP54_014097 [Fusarium duplospermum]
MDTATSVADIVPFDQDDAQETMAEWARLRNDLLKANPCARKRFCLLLQIIGLSLLGQYDGSKASELLARDEKSLLASFMEAEEDLEPGSFDYDHAHHIITLARSLLEGPDGEQNICRPRYDSNYSELENQIMLGAIIEVEGSCSMENIDPVQMHQTICRSTLIGQEHLELSEVIQLIATSRRALQDWVLV